MWCKSRHQSAIAAKADVRSWHYSKIEWIPKIWRVAALLMMLGGGLALTTVASAQTPAQVTTASERVESLDTQPNETYENLMKRAEAMAQAAAQQAFQQPDVNAVTVTVLGQNQGEIAPILTLAVSRQQWDSEGQTQRWATYFTSARSLLGFDNQNDTAANQVDNADTSSQNVDENVDQTQESPDEATSGEVESQDIPNRQQPPSIAPNAAPDTVPVEVPTPSPDGSPAPGTTNPAGSTTIINNNASPGEPPSSNPTNVAPAFPEVQPSNDGIIDDNSDPSAPNNEGIIPNDSPVTPNDPEQNLLDSAP